MYQTPLNPTPESVRDGRDVPTRGREDQATADARRDPTGGALANPLDHATPDPRPRREKRDAHVVRPSATLELSY
jgi:hypothetical protein